MEPLIFVSWLMNALMMYLNHPMLAMGIILMQVTLSAVILYLASSTPWASMILFLIYIGGLMILFIYITSLASNEKFNSLNNFMSSTIHLMTITSFTFLVMNFYENSFLDQSTFFKSLTKIFSSSSLILIMALMLYLFFILTVIKTMVESNTSALRPYFVYDKHSKNWSLN